MHNHLIDVAATAGTPCRFAYATSHWCCSWVCIHAIPKWATFKTRGQSINSPSNWLVTVLYQGFSEWIAIKKRVDLGNPIPISRNHDLVGNVMECPHNWCHRPLGCLVWTGDGIAGWSGRLPGKYRGDTPWQTTILYLHIAMKNMEKYLYVWMCAIKWKKAMGTYVLYIFVWVPICVYACLCLSISESTYVYVCLCM